jgi:ribose/xylose/arabinose/galactoside ABC-type transport system permease subunit
VCNNSREWTELFRKYFRNGRIPARFFVAFPKTLEAKVMEKRRSFLGALGRKIIQVREMGVILPIVLATILFASQNSVFLGQENLINMLRTASFTFITAIGMAFLIISGGWDLSVGAVYAFAGVACGLLMSVGVPIPVAILGGCMFGFLFGIINGFFVQSVGLPPFVATMSSMYMARGLVTGFQKGNPVYPLPDAFNAIGQENLMLFGIPIPYVLIVALAFGLIASFVLKKTSYGRMIFAVGGNAETSRLAGIPVRFVRFSAYVLTGMLAALTGILMAARMGSAQPNTGSGFEMQVIAACVIGGVSLNGGAGSVLGALLGSVFMTMIANGMTLTRVSPYWQQLVMGLVLLLACSLDQARMRMKK